VRGIGHGIPARIMTNAELEKLVETSDEWIVQRTGIRERRICAEGEAASHLSIAAAEEALARAGIAAEEVDLVIVGTVSGDMLFPSTACLVQDAIGANRAGAFDVGAACAGFIYALATGAAMLENGMARTALVVGVDVLSKVVDWTDRSTCVLFGDAAGAVVIRAEEGGDRGVLKTVLLSDGSGACHIKLEVGGSLHPPREAASAQFRDTLFMAGAETYRFAVNAMGDACCRVLEEAGLTPDQVDLFVPHQANLRIIDSAASRLQLPPEKVFVNVDRYGNTSAGSIPLALYEAETSGRLRPGMLVLTVGFGAGLVWGANLIRW
jgi:3-oxoacyl-[acyl-carrier-protein] synthase-3